MITFAILLPFGGRYVPPDWALALAALQYPTNTSHVFLTAKKMKRDEARNYLAEKALELKCKYLLFIDDDTMVPMDTIKQLHAALETADDDVVACGGIYTTKAFPSEPLVYMHQDSGPHWKWRFGQVFPCWGLGTGCLMIKASALEKIQKPWFRDINSLEEVGDDPGLTLNPGLSELVMTDDMYFFSKAHSAGLKALAHGGVLPVHWDQSGNPFTLPRDSYPMVGAKAPWYQAFGVLDQNTLNNGGDEPLPDGFLSQPEIDELIYLAKDRDVLEMGAYKGRSTVCMARAAKSVTSVDWHNGDCHVDKLGQRSTKEEYLKNIARYPNVKPIIGRIEEEVPKLAGNSYDLVFVDASHDFESVQRDMRLAMSFNPRVIAVHDFGLFDVTPALEAMGLTPTIVVDTLAVFEMSA